MFRLPHSPAALHSNPAHAYAAGSLAVPGKVVDAADTVGAPAAAARVVGGRAVLVVAVASRLVDPFAPSSSLLCCIAQRCGALLLFAALRPSTRGFGGHSTGAWLLQRLVNIALAVACFVVCPAFAIRVSGFSALWLAQSSIGNGSFGPGLRCVKGPSLGARMLLDIEHKLFLGTDGSDGGSESLSGSYILDALWTAITHVDNARIKALDGHNQCIVLILPVFCLFPTVAGSQICWAPAGSSFTAAVIGRRRWVGSAGFWMSLRERHPEAVLGFLQR